MIQRLWLYAVGRFWEKRAARLLRAYRRASKKTEENFRALGLK